MFTKIFGKSELPHLPEPDSHNDHHAAAILWLFEAASTASLTALVVAEDSASINEPSGF